MLEWIFPLVDTADSLHDGGLVLDRDRNVGAIVPHAATEHTHGELFVATDEKKILRLVQRGQRAIRA